MFSPMVIKSLDFPICKMSTIFLLQAHFKNKMKTSENISWGDILRENKAQV